MIHSAAKVRLSERKSKFICIFPSVSTFGEARGTIKREKKQIYLHFSEQQTMLKIKKQHRQLLTTLFFTKKSQD
jgi:putative IMPACT (imprinted ancient) family translation regulator